MKSATVVVIGFLLSLLTIFIFSTTIENGDINAVSMYFVVFLIPCVLMAVFNGVYIPYIKRLRGKPFKAVLSQVPLIIFLILSFANELVIRGIDGNLVFVVWVGAVAIGLTNFIWMLRVLMESKTD